MAGANRSKGNTRTTKQAQSSIRQSPQEKGKKVLCELRTEKDGRLYAIAMLQAMEEERYDNGFSPFSHSAEARDTHDDGLICIYRPNPQKDTLKRWIGQLYQDGSGAAVNGFYLVMTDYIGSVMDGLVPRSGNYVELERKGKPQPWGSVIYRDPQAAAKAIASGKTQYRPGSRRDDGA